MWWSHDIKLKGENQQIKFIVEKCKVMITGKTNMKDTYTVMGSKFAIMRKETLESLWIVLWKHQLSVQNTNGVLENF